MIKTNKTRLLINIITKSLIFVLSFQFYLLSADFNWEVVTNLNDAKDILIVNDTLYAATSGGFVVKPPIGNGFEKWTAENGLSDHNFTTLCKSDKNQIILGTLYGVISFYNKIDKTFYEDYSLQGDEIISLNAIEDTLWIITKDLVAVYLFDNNKQKFQFIDFFTNFDRPFESFRQVLYHNNRVWVASDNGLFYANGNFLRNNLKSASNWKTYTTENGLPSNYVSALADIADTLFIGTSVGFTKYTSQGFSNISSGLDDKFIRHISIRNDQVYVNNSRVVFRLDSTGFTELYRSLQTTLNGFDITSNEEIWVSYLEKGLRNVSTGESLKFNGPIDNSLGQPLLDRKRRLWVVSGAFKDERGRGFSVKLENGEWQNYRYLGGWRSTSSNGTIMEDSEGNIWIGSWNGGLIIIDPNLKFYHFNNYTSPGELWISSTTEDDTVTYNPPDSVRHFLSYTKSYPNLLVITDILMDPIRQSIWLSTYSVNSSKPIILYDQSNFNAAAFDSLSWEKIALNINTDEVAALTLDIFNNLWIGTERNGVVEMQLTSNGNINWENISESDNLKNNKVLAIAGDQDGYVWLGTQAGLNAYFNGNLFDFREDYQPIGLRINAIYVDGENNKWFATESGLSLLKASGSPWDPTSWVHFVPKRSDQFGENVFPSNLPSKEIRSVFVDDATGDVYCGTQSGLAILRSNPFTTPLPDLNEVKVGPIPLILSNAQNNQLYIRNLTRNSEIKILTSTGRLVRTINQSNSKDFFGSFAQWDGRNQNGKLVSSGVYLYLITDEVGNASSGKILVIRK